MARRHLGLAAALALIGCTPTSAPPAETLRVEGWLDGPAAGNLDAPAEWVVELRDPKSGRVLAEQRGMVSVGQPPIPFVLTVEAAALDAAQRYTLRAAVRAQGQVRWLSEPRPIEAPQARTDIGSLRLMPYTHPGGFATTLDCGGRRVIIGYVGEQLRLTDGSQAFDLGAVRGSTPPRFELAGAPSTFVQLDDRSATVSVQGRLLPRCVATPQR